YLLLLLLHTRRTPSQPTLFPYTTLFRSAIETPAKPADQVHHRIEQRHRLPERRQHVDRVETATEKRQRRHHHQRNDLQFLEAVRDRKSTRLNSSHVKISYAVFCLKKKRE